MFNHKNRKLIILNLVLAGGIIFSSVFVFLPARTSAQADGALHNAADKVPKCYSEADETAAVNCPRAGGTTSSSVSYKDASGKSINGPVESRCYLLTNPGLAHQIWQEQSRGICENLAVASQRGAGSQSNIEADCTDGADAANCGITRYLVLFINVLSVLAGIVIAGSIAYGGIQYSASASDPQRVSEAKDRIRNAIIALIFFIFGYSILNYLIPGGLF